MLSSEISEWFTKHKKLQAKNLVNTFEINYSNNFFVSNEFLNKGINNKVCIRPKYIIFFWVGLRSKESKSLHFWLIYPTNILLYFCETKW
jgi:hypothetical protein